MLLQVRGRKAQKKCNKTTLQSFTSVNSITSNPEIQVLLDKLQFMTGEFYEQKPNPLNLVEWGRIKYIPTESQNRIKIQNRISMKKADDEKMRPRIKPIKRYSLTQQKSRKEKPLSYKEHYKEILQSLNQKKRNMEDQSEEQIIQNKDSQARSSEGFKYYNNIKKYTHLLSYIQDKISTKEVIKMSRNSLIIQKNLTMASKTIQNEKAFSKMRKTSLTAILGNSQNQIKIDSIIKKWKPRSRNERKMMTNENRYSSSNRSRTKELMNTTIKMASPRYASELNLQTSLEKQHFSQIIRVK